MLKMYRIYVLDEIPPDLKDRISALHATALLQARNQGVLKPESNQNTAKHGKRNRKGQD